MYTVYVLQSLSRPNKTYCGQTNHLILRFHQHNNPDNKGYTKKFQPWTVIHCEYFTSRAQAMKKEKWFKSGVGRQFIKKIITPE